MPLNVETFGIDRVFEDLSQVFAPVARSRGISFECFVDGDLGPMTTDRMKLLEILNNLLSNAFKFTDRGRIGVRAHAVPGAERVRFQVDDTGIGIPPQAVAQPSSSSARSARAIGGTRPRPLRRQRLTDLLR
jgi:signal transduction histidine kinase